MTVAKYIEDKVKKIHSYWNKFFDEFSVQKLLMLNKYFATHFASFYSKNE